MKGVFVWKVQPGVKAEFERRWQAGSERWQRKPGARGTRLHKGIEDPLLYLGYASWDSFAARQHAEEMMRTEERVHPELRETATDPISELVFAGFFEDPPPGRDAGGPAMTCCVLRVASGGRR